ncbi:MAG TPA: 4Fe-4S binding protein [Ktedonobacteraceae bacterium]|nr:4Fe-4S binding protein [Ktedonobacteraceae bacterium]
MIYVITQPCICVKDGLCVDVCPVDCIHPAACSPI